MTIRLENIDTSRSRALSAVIAITIALAACGSAGQGLDPETLAMVDESTSSTVDETTTSVPEIEAPESADSEDPEAAPESKAPTTVPMSAPDASTPETPAPTAAGDAPPTSQPPATSAPTDPPVAADELVQAEAESFRLLNELRASLGLSQLARTGEMDSFARNWSQTMATTGNFEHSNGPYGENIAWNSQGSLTPAEAAAAMHEMWINSPGHYANMTSTDYTLAGMGFYKDATGWHATHVFDR